MLQALSFLFGSLLLLVIAGAPCVKALNLSENEAPHQFWSYSAVIGFTAISLVLRITTMLGIPIKILAWIVLPISLFFFVFYYMRKGGYPKVPALFLLGMLLVVFVSSAGYLKMGAFFYNGFNWQDNLDTVAKTQVLMDYGGLQSTEFRSDLLIWSGLHRGARNVVLGYFSSIFMQPAVSLLGVIMLLCPLFFYGLITSISDEVNPVWIFISAATCALIPGINMLTAEGFTGASTFAFLLLAFVVFFNKLLQNPSWKNMIACFLILSAANLSYSEPMLFMYGILFIMLLWKAISDPRKIVKSGVYSAIIILCNFISAFPYFKSFSRGFNMKAATTNVLDGVYPFAQTPEAMCVLFFGLIPSDYAKSVPYSNAVYTFLQKDIPYPYGVEKYDSVLKAIFPCLSVIGIIILLIGLIGLSARFFSKRDHLSLALLALAMAPSVFWGLSSWYQYYRMLSMICPLYILGAWEFRRYLFDNKIGPIAEKRTS